VFYKIRFIALKRKKPPFGGCKMRRDEPARLNNEKNKIHPDLEMNTIAELSNFMKTYNKPD